MDSEKRTRIWVALVESIDIVDKWTTMTDDYRGNLYDRTAKLKASLGYMELKHWLEGKK